MTGYEIRKASEAGFIIKDASSDEIIAAFSSIAEACDWLELQFDPPQNLPQVEGPFPRVIASREDKPGMIERAIKRIQGEP